MKLLFLDIDGGTGLTQEHVDEVIRRFQDVSETPIIHNNTSEDVTAGEVGS